MAMVKRERASGRIPLTHGGVIAQVWRGGHGRQAQLARLLKSVAVAPLDDELGKRAGMLLAQTGGSDAIDAAVIALASEGDFVLTSDTRDLRTLAEAAGITLNLLAV